MHVTRRMGGKHIRMGMDHIIESFQNQKGKFNLQAILRLNSKGEFRVTGFVIFFLSV